jgi:hypothetical protein
MTAFTSMSIFCLYSIVFNPFLIIVMKSQALSFTYTRAILFTYGLTSFVLSTFIYYGGEHYREAEIGTFCWVDISATTSLWSRYTCS